MNIANGRSAASTGELIRRAAELTARLVRAEVALTRVHLERRARAAGRGIGLFVVAAVLALYGVAALLAAVALGLAEVLPAWAAVGIVGAVLCTVTAVLALLGRRSVRTAMPFVPSEALGSLRADAEEVTRRALRRPAQPGGSSSIESTRSG